MKTTSLMEDPSSLEHTLRKSRPCALRLVSHIFFSEGCEQWRCLQRGFSVTLLRI
ncbi:hypothetical protein RchiOBHm_Chr2g0147171 [Rosa chinensis]|uniref:Uncharacterized protein n=1 Tax=Rosa chinensis TaxID=74649 RepID=A0A2P6RZ27_ROSCH|nr:hypothetical protein RchiOBHm_Chr2g0147171 [Rosa chinensis]